jgi:hypothetical protein
MFGSFVIAGLSAQSQKKMNVTLRPRYAGAPAGR